MKIAMFTDSYKPQVNGVVTSVELFSRHLKKHGHEVTIFAPKVPRYKDKEKFVYRFSSMPFHAYKEYRIALPTPLRRMPKRFDVVHIQSPFSVGCLGLAFAKHYGLPVVGSFHTFFHEYSHYFVPGKLRSLKEMNFLFNAVMWKYLSLFYNKCDIVIVPTEEVKRVVQARIKKRIEVIPTGVDFRPVRESKKGLRRRHGFDADDTLLLHVGRITKEKNISFLLDALLDMLNGNTKLIIASDGPYAAELKRQAAVLGIKNNVIFTGYLPEKQLSEFYSMCDAFLMASETETQGLVVLEAAVSGLPVVCLNDRVIAPFVRKEKLGIVSSTNNYAKDVKRALGRKQKQNKELLRKFGMESCAKKLAAVYEDVIGYSETRKESGY